MSGLHISLLIPQASIRNGLFVCAQVHVCMKGQTNVQVFVSLKNEAPCVCVCRVLWSGSPRSVSSVPEQDETRGADQTREEGRRRRVSFKAGSSKANVHTATVLYKHIDVGKCETLKSEDSNVHSVDHSSIVLSWYTNNNMVYFI